MSEPLATDNRDHGLCDDSNADLQTAVQLGEGGLEEQQHADLQAAIGLSLMENQEQVTIGTKAMLTSDIQNEESSPGALPQSIQRHELHPRPESLARRLARKLTSSIEAAFSPSQRGPKLWRYKALKRSRSIRLLCLQSELSSLPELVTFSMDSPYLPYYTTLSYAWGKTFQDGSHLTEVLPCKGGPLKVTKNLRRALDCVYETRSIWNEDKRKLQWIWIDSICINLADPRERSNQVAHMPEIFAKCEKMIIWLGEHSDSTKQWLDTLHSVWPGLDGSMFWPKNAKRFEQNLKYLPQNMKELLKSRLGHPPVELPECWIAIYEDIIHGVSRPKADGSDRSLEVGRSKEPRDRRAYVELTQRPWFHRKWVIQEMAQTSGKHRHFLIANQIKSFEEIDIGVRECSLEDVAKPLSAKLSNRTLLQNLFRYGDTQCSEPRDHIYALLGISNDISWLTTDYNQDVESLYTAVAEYYVKTGSQVAVLTLATVKRASKGLPSWVPDWREPWRCDRSAMHADVMTTLSYGNRKLWREEQGNSESAAILQYGSKKPPGLMIKTLVIPNCNHGVARESYECRKCKLLGDSRDSKCQGKQPLREEISHIPGPSLLSLHRAERQRKWVGVVREQFDVAMHPDEVLCLTDNCAVGFVLLPAGNVESPSVAPLYRLEYCFQVDEEGLMSNWFAIALGRECQEWICII